MPIVIQPALMRGALLVAALLLAPALHAEDTAGGVWAELTGERHGHASANRDPAILRMIDGVTVLDRTKVRVRPGMHSVLLRRNPKHGMHTSDRTLRIDAKPCKRYFINAQFTSPGSTLWQPVIDKVEQIQGCGTGIEVPEADVPATPAAPAKAPPGGAPVR